MHPKKSSLKNHLLGKACNKSCALIYRDGDATRFSIGAVSGRFIHRVVADVAPAATRIGIGNVDKYRGQIAKATTGCRPWPHLPRSYRLLGPVERFVAEVAACIVAPNLWWDRQIGVRLGQIFDRMNLIERCGGWLVTGTSRHGLEKGRASFVARTTDTCAHEGRLGGEEASR